MLPDDGTTPDPARPPNLFTYTTSIEIERAQAITWIRIQMAQYGLTLVDLQATGCFTETPPTRSPGAVRYCNAHGQVWDGRGAMPALAAATSCV
ncbi:H-NS histone family protein [Cupriavidus basilensis]|uniref:Uncharacterized protein n=1 Tax=Cupriavidus basilensis TaxID=68895 RepID=A0A0C4YF42_9BURK|nr:H-NS histone family protein [Cupriavidus basilensis]AJG19376.1 hypothetical protein RR42_m1981 [Cupriavidus basilensis]